MLAETPISGVRLAHITTDDAEALRFNHSPANANRALRTLRRMLGKAAEWGLIAAAPKIKLVKEQGRSAIIDSASEAALLAVAKQPLHDVLNHHARHWHASGRGFPHVLGRHFLGT